MPSPLAGPSHGNTRYSVCEARRDHTLIFVSHSCKDAWVANPPAGLDADKLDRLRFALALRDQLVARLDPGATGLLWYDRKRLQPGDEWELDIVAALHGCEAAILLLTPEALESPWVLREATVLGDRRSRWPGLRLVPVLCAGVDYRTLAAHPHWSALNITRWQPVQAKHGAFRGAAAQQDQTDIVNQVATQLQHLSTPRDPARERWTEELRAFLDQLERQGLKSRLRGAAQALGLKPPLAWDATAREQLAQSLLQANLAEADSAGALRYPLPEALSQLVPGDPLAASFTQEEKQFCDRLRPLAAPPGAAVAVGAANSVAGSAASSSPAGSSSPGKLPTSAARPTPVLLSASDWRVADLAARRASCNLAWVRPLSGVVGEGASPSAADLHAVNQALRMAALGKKPCYVVATFQTVAGEDPAVLAADLAAKLAAPAALVGVVGRGPRSVPAAGADGGGGAAAAASAAIFVDIPEADEAAAVLVAEFIDLLCGSPAAHVRGGT